jgi:predicted DNA-binding protein
MIVSVKLTKEMADLLTYEVTKSAKSQSDVLREVIAKGLKS